MKRPRRALTRWLGPPAMHLVARSWRMELIGSDRWAAATGSGRPYVILSWHESLLPVLWQHRRLGIAAVVSEARDGQLLAALARRLGYRLIAGSSTRGGTRALRAAISALRSGTSIGLTPDGPRGPRRKMKAGAVVAAERSGALIIPVHADARPAWRVRSWDRFLVPPPFARIRLAYGEPFVVEGNRVEAVMRAGRELEAAARLAAWPDGAAIPTA